MLGTLLAFVFGSAFEQSIHAGTRGEPSQVQAAVGSAVANVDAPRPQPGARAKADASVSVGLAQAEPLLLLLLGSMLFCVAAGISVWVSRVEQD